MVKLLDDRKDALVCVQEMRWIGSGCKFFFGADGKGCKLFWCGKLKV